VNIGYRLVRLPNCRMKNKRDIIQCVVAAAAAAAGGGRVGEQ
jgi:hypothetical protein